MYQTQEPNVKNIPDFIISRITKFIDNTSLLNLLNSLKNTYDISIDSICALEHFKFGDFCWFSIFSLCGNLGDVGI